MKKAAKLSQGHCVAEQLLTLCSKFQVLTPILRDTTYSALCKTTIQVSLQRLSILSQEFHPDHIPQLLIHLTTSNSFCLERQLEQNRGTKEEECNFYLDYLKLFSTSTLNIKNPKIHIVME